MKVYCLTSYYLCSEYGSTRPRIQDKDFSFCQDLPSPLYRPLIWRWHSLALGRVLGKVLGDGRLAYHPAVALSGRRESAVSMRGHRHQPHRPGKSAHWQACATRVPVTRQANKRGFSSYTRVWPQKMGRWRWRGSSDS